MQIDPSVWDAIREFGFPIFVAIAIGFALYKRWFVSGPDSDAKLAVMEKTHQDEVAAMQKQIDYTEARRREERQARLATEQRLVRNLKLSEQQALLLKDLSEVLRKQA